MRSLRKLFTIYICFAQACYRNSGKKQPDAKVLEEVIEFTIKEIDEAPRRPFADGKTNRSSITTNYTHASRGDRPAIHGGRRKVRIPCKSLSRQQRSKVVTSEFFFRENRLNTLRQRTIIRWSTRTGAISE